MSLKLLKDLNFADKLSKCEALTEAGKEFVNKYRGYLFNNPANCSLVNGFVKEASNFSYDTGLVGILESVTKFIQENNISWQLATACEGLANNNSSYGYIAKLGINQVQKLLEMNESDVVSYIKAGSLKSVQYIPEFRNICKQVFKQQISEKQFVNYSIVNPISYVMIGENNEQYFKVNQHTYKIAEGKVEEVSNVTDKTFNYVNALLESFTKDGENIFYEYKTPRTEFVRFTINENGLTFTKGKNINEKFDSAVDFRQYCNVLSKSMNINEKMDFMNKAEAIATVFENIHYVVSLDNVRVINTNNGFSGAIVEAKDNVNLTVFHSVQGGTSSNNYEFVVEALNNVTKLTGIDLSHEYSERINEDCKKDHKDADLIKEQLEANKDAQFNIRKKKIAMLAESYKNDPVKIALLNNIARDLKTLE